VTSGIFIGLGSNQGNRLLNLNHAFNLTSQLPKVQSATFGIIVESKAHVLPGDDSVHPDFLNSVAHLETTYSPHELLNQLMNIEKQMGRVRTKPWVPRIIDLDILLFGNLEIKDAQLTIPHPHMNKRDFVLIPLRELQFRLLHKV
jgi:2-amino-4-hydroxy-6-hydroxymethyldihydropteridine diphosphokinase